MSITFEGRVAIVTGAGNGLGRCHALGLAARGAKVAVNDMGPAAEAVADEIRAAGGEAMAIRADVSDFAATQALSAQVLERWGRIDILVNNAGILRDRSFVKLDADDFARVLAVHLTGSFNCSKAVWETMRGQAYGRIVFTSSGSGLFGNFGQANYGAAKAGMVGLMNVLHIEGRKYGIRVNTLAPTAATAMTDGLFAEEHAALLVPETITPGLLYLVSEEAPSRVIMGAGGGCFSRIVIRETQGACIDPALLTPEAVAAQWDTIVDETGALDMPDALSQPVRFARMAAARSPAPRPSRG